MALCRPPEYAHYADAAQEVISAIHHLYISGEMIMDLQLQRRTVLVTGSSAGIGRATAIAFGREGARVAVTYHKKRERAEQTATDVREAGGEALVVRYDLGDDDSIYQAVRQVNERWGTIDVLVNNAADMLAIDATKAPDGADRINSGLLHRLRTAP
jgi:NAD(P)-dependent dehydrogenase (short-subunit alcohol dehydrogenase family)